MKLITIILLFFNASAFADNNGQLSALIAMKLQQFMQAPWSEKKLKELNELIEKNQKEIKQIDPLGHISQKIYQYKLIGELHNKIIECAGNSPRANSIAKNMFSDLNFMNDCWHRGNNLEKTLAPILALQDVVNYPITNSTLTKDFRDRLLKKTVIKIVQVQSQLLYLVDTGKKIEDLPAFVVKLNCTNKACPKDLKEALVESSKDNIDQLATDYNRLTPKFHAEELKKNAEDLFSTFYRSTKKPSEHSLVSRVAILTPENQKEFKESTDPQLAYESWKNGFLLNEMPKIYFNRKKEIVTNPLTHIFSRFDEEFATTTGFDTEPMVYNFLTKHSIVLAKKTADEKNGTQLLTPLSWEDHNHYKDYISEKRIKKLYNEVLETTSSQAQDLITDAYIKKMNPEEQLEQLILINPIDAGRALMEKPELFYLICQTLKIIAKKDKRVEWLKRAAFTGELILGLFPFARVTTTLAKPGVEAISSATVVRLSGAAAGSMALSIGLAGYEIANNSELAKIYFTSCLAQTSSPESCDQFKKAVEDLHSGYDNLIMSAAVGSGMLKLISNMRSSAKEISTLAKNFKSYAPEWKKIGGDKIDELLGADLASELHLYLANENPAKRKQLLDLIVRKNKEGGLATRDLADQITSVLKKRQCSML